MSNATDEQPAPIKTDKRPIWPEVMAYVARNYADDEASGAKTVTNLLADMQARHELGIKRYGVPLTAGNGRDSMTDAYQELLDFVVYTRTYLEDRGIEVLAPGVILKPSDGLQVAPDGESAEVADQAALMASLVADPIEHMMANLFVRATDALCSLRGALTELGK